METTAGSIEVLVENIKAYGKTTLELVKLKSIETTANATTWLIARMSVLITFFCFVLLLSFGVAVWLGDLLGKLYYGLFIVAGFYFIMGILFHFYFHQWIKKPVGNSIVNELLQ